MIDEIPFREFRERTESDSSDCSSFSHCEECAINHQHSYSDPARILYNQEEVTSFIEPGDVNVTCCDDMQKSPLSPEESLKNIQRMNCPKVLPEKYPENHQFNDSTKRRSLQIPPQYYQIHQANSLSSRSRPNPPPRMSSTLGRKNSKTNSSGFLMTEPLKAEEPPVPTIPEITSSSLTVGPLLPKPENIYMSMQRKKSLSRQNSMSSENQQNPPPETSLATDQHLYAEIIKNSRVQQPQDGIYSITTGAGNKQLQAMNSLESNSSSSSEESSTGTIKEYN